jgi:hypothetical protein
MWLWFTEKELEIKENKLGVNFMEWLSYLLLLICPLMMIFCMKGMVGHKHHHNRNPEDIRVKLSKLEQENERLRKEIDCLSSMVKKES